MSHTQVGKLNKAFGINGLIKVIPNKAFINDLKSSKVWFVDRRNERIPYFVERIEYDPHFLVKFEDINSPEAAKYITGCTIWLRDKDISITVEEENNDLDKLIGFEVFNLNESIGTIVEIEEFPQQLMAIIKFKDGQFLMPLTPEFIVNLKPEIKRLEVELPDGFLESQQ